MKIFYLLVHMPALGEISGPYRSRLAWVDQWANLRRQILGPDGDLARIFFGRDFFDLKHRWYLLGFAFHSLSLLKLFWWLRFEEAAEPIEVRSGDERCMLNMSIADVQDGQGMFSEALFAEETLVTHLAMHTIEHFFN
jgi:hypothetical protein